MSTALSSAVGVLALLLAVAALVLATVANRRWSQRPRPGAQPGAQPGHQPGQGLAAAGIQGAARAHLQAQVDDLGAALSELRGAVTACDATALRHVAVVRYDAFADVGGRLSYSLALLDDTRSGLVLTTLAGKSDVRTYVRTISAGAGEGTLTAEEQQAIDAAFAGAPGSQP